VATDRRFQETSRPGCTCKRVVIVEYGLLPQAGLEWHRGTARRIIVREYSGKSRSEFKANTAFQCGKIVGTPAPPEDNTEMSSSRKSRRDVFEFVEPIGLRVLVRKDEPKRQTRGGIALPDSAEIPTITGRIVTISAAIENDEDIPLRQYDKVLFHPKNAIPVDFESDNQLFVVPAEDIVAVFRREVRQPDGESPDEPE
jgi:chaperonin GroES